MTRLNRIFLNVVRSLLDLSGFEGKSIIFILEYKKEREFLS